MSLKPQLQPIEYDQMGKSGSGTFNNPAIGLQIVSLYCAWESFWEEAAKLHRLPAPPGLLLEHALGLGIYIIWNEDFTFLVLTPWGEDIFLK